MSTQTPARNTAYAEYVFANLPSIVRSGGGLYTYTDLASMVGLKPTHNFRKRVKQMVAVGLLFACAAFTPRGGIEARFTTSGEDCEKELTF